MDDHALPTAPGTVRIQRLLPGPAERVWSYLVDSDKRRLWMASGAIDAKAGGRAEHVFRTFEFAAPGEAPPARYREHAGEVPMTGRVTACVPPLLLAYTWNDGGDDPSEVRFELVPKGGKVLLVVTHSRIDRRDRMTSFAAGWHTHLDRLGDLMAGRPAGGFWTRHARLEAEYERRIPPG